MLLQRTLFFLAKVLGVLAGASFGLAGAAYIATLLFGPHPSPWQLVACVALAAVGIAVGFTGGLALVVLPLHFRFSTARRLFSWERSDPQFVFRFYQWYGKQLQEYGAARERGDA